MNHYDVGFNTETFRHYIVKAISPEVALAKGWDLYQSGEEPYDVSDGVVQETGVMAMTESEVAKLPGFFLMPDGVGGT